MSLGFEGCIVFVMHSPLQFFTEKFHSPKNTLCYTLFIPTLLLATHKPLETVDPFIIWLCPECRIELSYVGLIQYVTFSAWVLSLNSMYLKCLYVFMAWYLITFCCWIIFLFWIYYHSLFTHSLTGEHHCCFQNMAFMKKAAINVHSQVFVCIDTGIQIIWVNKYLGAWLWFMYVNGWHVGKWLTRVY